MSDYKERWTTVRVEVEENIGWVILNRPEKRNAMSPTMNREMREILEVLELDDAVKVLVLPGAMRLRRERVCTACTPASLFTTYMDCNSGWSNPV